jgi:hypothetical protein
MQNELEHLGNDLGIDGKSYTSSSLSSNSDSESSSSSSLSEIRTMCYPASDLFRKRLFIAINKHSKLFYEAAQAFSFFITTCNC